MARAYNDPAIRVTLLPRDTNAHGTIFGGIILSYIDIAGAVGAHRVGIPRVVTVAMNGVVFHEPVFVGDLISCYAWPTRVGRTSITIHVLVEAERALTMDQDGPARLKVTEADCVYVAIDEDRKPASIAHLKPRIEAVIRAHQDPHAGVQPDEARPDSARPDAPRPGETKPDTPHEPAK